MFKLNRSFIKTASLRALVALCAALLLAACGDDAGSDTDTTTDTQEGPLYAVSTEIYSADFSSSVSLIAVVPSLEVDEIDFEEAREFNGRATIASIGEWLFVAEGEEPVVHRFSINDDGTLSEAGRLSFANYGLTTWSIDKWGNTVVSPTKAYLVNAANGSHIVWDPSALEIVGEVETEGLVDETLTLQASPAVVRGDKLFRMYTWYDWANFEWSSKPQMLGVYDVENDQLVELVEQTDCPSLYGAPSLDEEGNIYFSNFVWSPMEALVLDGPASCARRVPAGQESFDEDWTLTYTDITDGREAGVLRYIGDGAALLDVFHDERAEITAETDPATLGRSANWRLWSIDLEAKTGAPLEGIDFKPAGYSDVEIDGRTFLLLPSADYASTTAYEISGGEAVKAFEMQGASYNMVELNAGAAQ